MSHFMGDAMSEIGRISEVPIRDVWAHEARDFTSWLATAGIEHLTDQLGLQLADAATEQPEGDLFADIVATDSEGRTVVIENQLERTDHGHLGQVVTYLAIEGAQAAIWISPEPRAEHVIPGLPLNFHAWVTSTEAYAEIRIQDESDEASDAMFNAFLERKSEIEQAYGGPLVWDRLEGNRGAKIDTERIDIGKRTEPSEDSLIQLADASNRLIDSIKPLAESAVAEAQARAATYSSDEEV